MAPISKKIKIAFKNGRSQGYARGFIDGHRLAMVQIAEELEGLAKRKVASAKRFKPLKSYCWCCFTGVDKSGDKKKSKR